MHDSVKTYQDYHKDKGYRIEYGTKDQPYCKAVDRTCRNHGGRPGGSSKQCIWCLDNRTKKDREKDKIAKKELKDFLNRYKEF